MLDTDTCVYLLNRRDRSLEATFEEHAGAICISAIAHAELCYGVEHSTQVDRNRHELRSSCVTWTWLRSTGLPEVTTGTYVKR